jgi:maltose-binding protein MalE
MSLKLGDLTKKMKNKIFRSALLYLIFITIVILLVDCRRSSLQKFIVWSSLRPIERELLQSKLNQFGKNYSDYEFVQLFYSPEELRTNFIISALVGKGPALIHGASDNIGPLSELGVIKPMEDLFTKEFLDSFITEPFRANTYFDGHLYQIADRVGNHLCLVYNKEMISQPPETMADLIKIGKQLVEDLDGDGSADRYALAWNYTEPFFAVPFIGGYGGWILDDDNRPTLDNRAVVKAAAFIYELANTHKIIPREADYETANALFIDKRVAMIINGPWSWATYINNNIDIGLARIPKINETNLWPSPIVSPLGYSINVNLKGQELNIATELIRFLTSSEIELEFASRFRIIPSRKDAIISEDLQADELWRNALDQMMVGKPMPVITELRWIWDAMRPAYQGIFTNQITPEQAAKEMQRLAEKLIAENRD